MTAFGSGQTKAPLGHYICEIRTLNSRYLEVSVRLPRFLVSLEPQVIALVKKKLARGKVEVNFSVQLDQDEASLPQVNMTALKHYLDAHEQICAALHDKYPGQAEKQHTLHPTDFFRLEGVLQSPLKSDVSSERAIPHQEAVFRCLDDAIEKVLLERQREGSTLANALRKLLAEISEQRSQISCKANEVQKSIYANYLKRLESLTSQMEDAGMKSSSDLPQERLIQEVAVLTDKSDIEEELTRLGVHIDELSKACEATQPIGRKMDFLCQEMHREVNTMSNKLVQTSASQHSITMKQQIEQIRQQVQNIE